MSAQITQPNGYSMFCAKPARPQCIIGCYEDFHAEQCPNHPKELRELLNAISLFVENYRTMHAGTLYAAQVDAAADRVEKKLLEL